MSDTYHPSVLLLARTLSGRPIQVLRASRKVVTPLLKTALNHGVTAVFDCRVREGIVHGMADQDQKVLRVANREQIAYDLMLTAATWKTIDLLATADIPVLLLKGTPIAFQYYQAPYLRIRCDTDLFIRAADVNMAAEVLASNGYRLSAIGYRAWTKDPTLPSNSSPCSHPDRISLFRSIFTGNSATALSSTTSCNSRNAGGHANRCPNSAATLICCLPPPAAACLYPSHRARQKHYA